MSKKPTYQQSRLNNFEFCAWGYFLSEIEGIRGLGSFELCRGNGVHKARLINLAQKIKSGEDLSLPLMLDAARDEIVRQVDDGYIDLHCEQLDGLNKKAAAGRIIDTTVKMVEVDRRQLQSQIQPLLVEERIAVDLGDWPFNLSCKADSIDADHYITDCKSTRAKWNQEKADTEYQPSTYYLAHKAKFLRYPVGFRYHCVVCTPKKQRVYAYPLITMRTDEQILSVLNRFEAMHQSIQLGNFPPTHQSNWKCGQKYCELYPFCKFVRR